MSEQLSQNLSQFDELNAYQQQQNNNKFTLPPISKQEIDLCYSKDVPLRKRKPIQHSSLMERGRIMSQKINKEQIDNREKKCQSLHNNQSQPSHSPEKSIQQSICNKSFQQPLDPKIIRVNQLYEDFQKKLNPYQQGLTRHDRMKYNGSPDDKSDIRLNKYYTLNYSQRVKPEVKRDVLSNCKSIFGDHQVTKNFKGSKIIQDILKEKDILEKKEEIINNLYKLRDLNLLDDKKIAKVNTLPQNAVVKFVYNDYHSRATNNGYVRNGLGCFYTK